MVYWWWPWNKCRVCFGLWNKSMSWRSSKNMAILGIQYWPMGKVSIKLIVRLYYHDEFFFSKLGRRWQSFHELPRCSRTNSRPWSRSWGRAMYDRFCMWWLQHVRGIQWNQVLLQKRLQLWMDQCWSKYRSSMSMRTLIKDSISKNWRLKTFISSLLISIIS